MKILHVITSLRTGGAEHLMVDLLPRLCDMGNDVDLAVFDGTRTPFYEQLESQGIRIIQFAIGGSVYNPLHIFKLVILMWKYNVVHTHNTACQMFAAAASYFCSAKMVTTEHSTSTRRRKYKIFKLIDKWMYSRYDKIICISEPSESSLRKYLGDGYPIITIKNGIDTKKFIDAEPIELGLGNVVKITMVAGFRYEKDQATVIKAMKLLPAEYHLILVGNGIERANLVNLIETEGLQERVHLLGIRNDVPNILKASDIVVMSSHREGLSLSNVEGMCSGHPFIASDVEGLREVTDGYGILFPHGDSKTLAEIIVKLSNDKPFANEVSARCKERAMQYDISVMVEKYNEVYKELCA